MEQFEKILKIIEEEDIEFIYLLFVDIKGHFRSIQTPSNLIYQTLNYGFVANTSDLKDFNGNQYITLFPDINTFTILPWRPQQGKCASLICQVNTVNNIPIDSRKVVNQIYKKCINKELFFDIVPSIQFFAFHTDEDGTPTTFTHSNAQECDFSPSDLAVNLRRDIVLTLMDCDIMFSSCSSKKDYGLQEITLQGGDLKLICDNITFAKSVCGIIAKRHGLYACFLPKPKNNIKGSCMPLKFKCLNDEEKNIFYDENSSNKLSSLCYNFIAGILKYIREICIITNPLINSYKRLASNQMPNIVAWTSSCLDSNLVLQIAPAFIDNDIMIQINSVDVSSNIYLALPLLIEAGVEGIEKKLVAPDEFNIEMLNNTDDELEKSGILRLPSTMTDALSLFKNSEFAKRVLGEDIFYQIIEIKEKECNEYKKYVSAWEINNYIHEY